jgi:hypothetical protein
LRGLRSHWLSALTSPCTSRNGQRSPPQCRRKPSARQGDQRGASTQSQLGARTSGPARRGLVQARDRAKARRVYACGDRSRDGITARSVLAHPRGCENSASAALGTIRSSDAKARIPALVAARCILHFSDRFSNNECANIRRAIAQQAYLLVHHRA